jgi:DNA-binding beta-propeller fold protein YncE
MKFKWFCSTILVVLVGAFLASPTPGQSEKSKYTALYVSNLTANTITMYDAETGALIRTLVKGGSELKGANGFAFGPDGSIYVSGQYSNNVVRYDGKTGKLIEILDPDNSAIISSPQGVNFGPDGLLYVTSMNNDKVVRFDTKKKAYVDTFCTVTLPGVAHAGPIDAEFGPDNNLYVGTYKGHKQLKYQGPVTASATAATAAPSAAPGTLLAVFDAAPQQKQGTLKTSKLAHKLEPVRPPVALQSYASGDFASYQAAQTASRTTRNAATTTTSTDKHFFVDVFDPETFTGNVVEYTLDGRYVRTFVETGSAGLVLPGGIAFGPGGDLFLANVLVDSNFNDIGSTILRFDGKTGASLGTFVTAGNGLSVPFAMRFGPR